MVVSQEVQSFL